MRRPDGSVQRTAAALLLGLTTAVSSAIAMGCAVYGAGTGPAGGAAGAGGSGGTATCASGGTGGTGGTANCTGTTSTTTTK